MFTDTPGILGILFSAPQFMVYISCQQSCDPKIPFFDHTIMMLDYGYSSLHMQCADFSLTKMSWTLSYYIHNLSEECANNNMISVLYRGSSGAFWLQPFDEIPIKAI